MRSQREIEAYEQELDSIYLSKTRVMTDMELHNVTVKINRAIGMYRNGLSKHQIKEQMKLAEVDPDSSVKMSKVEMTLDKIQRSLLDRGYEKGTPQFIKKQDKLLLEWARQQRQ